MELTVKDLAALKQAVSAKIQGMKQRFRKHGHQIYKDREKRFKDLHNKLEKMQQQRS